MEWDIIMGKWRWRSVLRLNRLTDTEIVTLCLQFHSTWLGSRLAVYVLMV